MVLRYAITSYAVACALLQISEAVPVVGRTETSVQFAHSMQVDSSFMSAMDAAALNGVLGEPASKTYGATTVEVRADELAERRKLQGSSGVTLNILYQVACEASCDEVTASLTTLANDPTAGQAHAQAIIAAMDAVAVANGFTNAILSTPSEVAGSLTEPTTVSITIPGGPPPAPMMNLVETLVSMPDTFSTLVTAVTAAGLVPTLSGAGPFTVFAPTNAAFAALGQSTIDSLLADPTGQLASILTYHVAAGYVLSSQLNDGMQIPTVEGGSITVTIDSSGVTLNGVATVIQADVECSNGVAHVIDAVLTP